MPWRKPSDLYGLKYGTNLKEGEYYDEEKSGFSQAYGALVSELMLQQTQCVRVCVCVCVLVPFQPHPPSHH